MPASFPLLDFILMKCRKSRYGWQAQALFRCTKRHCWPPPFVIEEERFSGNKHTSEYPQKSVDAMVAALRGMGRDITDIFAWLTTWDYPALAGTLARSVLEEAPQSLKLLRTTEAAGFDGRRLEQ